MTRTEVIEKLTNTYEKKNIDYGNSAHITFVEFGETALVVRISDKLSRLVSLLKNGEAQVNDESLLDTIGDAVTYLVMLVAELLVEPGDAGKTEEERKASEKNIDTVFELFDGLDSPMRNPDRPYDISQSRERLLHIFLTGDATSRRAMYLSLADRLLEEYVARAKEVK